MEHEIDIDNWYRRETYLHFKNFSNPFFGICTSIDITNLYNQCKSEQLSINLAIHFLSLRVANAIEEFRLRIVDGKVVKYGNVDAGATIAMRDNSFRYCLYPYASDFLSFCVLASKSEEAVRTTGMSDPRVFGQSVIHYSVVPWVSFSSISHARNNTNIDAIPKITFGKYQLLSSTLFLPLSLEVNHAVLDAYHVGLYLSKLQSDISKGLDRP